MTREGYAFAGWWTSASGGTKIAVSTKVTGNVTYYAHWTARTYTVMFNANGLSGGTTTVSRNYGQSLGTLPTLTRTGYAFAGWWTSASGGTQISSSTKVTGNVTYYAHWRIPGPGTLTMTVTAVNGGGRMKVTIRRTGGSGGRIAVKIKTQDSSTVGGINGIMGRDFEYLKDYLVWEDGDASDRVVYVNTYATDSTGAATLRLKLSVMTTGEYAGCATPTLASGGKVIATINPARKGTIVLAAPDPMSVVAGEPLRVKVRRTGGSDGRVAVKIKTQDSSTVNGINGRFAIDFQYVKETLVWGNGDASEKTVVIPTVAGWWNGGPKTFRLKLSAMTTGEYAGCVTPALASGGKVIASILPNEEAYPGEVFIRKIESVRRGTVVSVSVDEAPFWG